MIRRHFETLLWLATVTIGFAVTWVVLPADRQIEFHVFVLLVGLLATVALLSSIGEASPRARVSPLERALDSRAATPSAPDDLSRMERVVTMSVAAAHDFHTRLRPLLQDIAAARLERAGRQPGPETLGRWWELLRPDRPAPAERFAPGISERDLRDLVADLRRM